jgi:TPR repeat protein
MHPMAQANLGVMHERGHGTREDWVQALMWFIVSASCFRASEAKNRGLVIRNRDQLAAKMSPEQIAEARKRARAWRPSG